MANQCMRKISKVGLLIIGLLFCLNACGIKGDPVPPVEPVNWGDSMQNKDKDKEKKDENR